MDKPEIKKYEKTVYRSEGDTRDTEVVIHFLSNVIGNSLVVVAKDVCNEIPKMNLSTLNRLLDRNISIFKKNVDIVDLKTIPSIIIPMEIGYSNGSYSQSRWVFAFTGFGYDKFINLAKLHNYVPDVSIIEEGFNELSFKEYLQEENPIELTEEQNTETDDVLDVVKNINKMPVKYNKVITFNSVEVAKDVEKEHKNLLRDIRRYIDILSYAGIQSNEFFIQSYYFDKNNVKRECFDITRKGCELIGHKLNSVKGVLFSAKYIKKFEELTNAIEDSSTKKIENFIEKKPKKENNVSVPNIQDFENKKKMMAIAATNANANIADKLVKIANSVNSPIYKNLILSEATVILTGKRLLPCPELDEKTYTAEFIGKQIGISANKVGTIANKYKLKTSKYGAWFMEPTKNSAAIVQTFRYYKKVIQVIKNYLLNGDI